MKAEEAIKYLQQLYPNGGHCWLDEQRIEAISMAIKALQEEPVSNDLEEAAYQFGNCFENNFGLASMSFIKGAQWQKEQMEKNRIAHCDNITEEQYNLETGFLDGFLDKNKRMPTFLDAIEYGMKKATEE